MAKTLDAATAQELIERGLASVGGKRVVANAKPVIRAALEAVRQSARASGERNLPIKGISVVSGDDVIFQVANPVAKTPVDSKKKRIPIAYGGSNYTCILVYKGPPPIYACYTF
jgi:hypothetical protein